MKASAVLQAIMDDQGVTRVSLAGRMGVTPQTLDARCNGRRKKRG